ncbi:hypothetical protein JZ751_004584 [Albula glossodonta]|uniref:ethanolamine kinase n=1 Tax=Albula glossodonta TaxID=121402 RepID=A0A8T2N4W6_9TELE|nr:hypothetical protein JZ751_004584 [Albula glossodonta]
MANYINVLHGAPVVQRYNVTIDEYDLRTGVLNLMKLLRPHWKSSEVKMKYFTDGITNKLIGCYVGGAKEEVVLVRIYGNKTELFVDRENEVKSFRVLQAHRCAPQLYCTFRNGLCYEFLQGHPLDPKHLRNPFMFRLIARHVAQYHSIRLPDSSAPKASLWLKMDQYLSLAPAHLQDPAQNLRFSKSVPRTERLRQEMLWLQRSLSALDSPVVLCHNDLLSKNIIYNQSAGVSEVDYSLYPDQSLQLQWLRAYLEAYNALRGQGEEVSNREVEVLYVQVNNFALASHFLWALWAVIQAEHSSIDFDFLGYAILRFDQYFKMKPEVTALTLSKQNVLYSMAVSLTDRESPLVDIVGSTGSLSPVLRT